MENMLYDNDITGIHKRIKDVLDDNHDAVEDNTITLNKYAVTDAELRAAEYEMKKFSAQMNHHSFLSRLTAKSSVLEKKRKAAVHTKHYDNIQDIHNALDNSHDKWLKCALATKKKYITSYIYRKYGIKQPVKVVKKRKSVIPKSNIISFSLNTTTNDKNDKNDKNKKNDENKNDKKNKNTHIDELPDEGKEELKLAFDNLKNKKYDNTGYISYDPTEKRIIELAIEQ